MEKIFNLKNKKWIALLLALIILLGNFLRESHYAKVPHPGESADEYSFGWLGISLFKEHKPIAWSGLPAYEKHNFQKINVDSLFDNDPHRPLFSIDQPWFDHPPLFGVITGGYAYSKGVTTFENASVSLLRRPMLKIAILTTILIFILGYKVYGPNTGLLAALIYSVSPFMVISSRLALSENGYIPLFLASIICAVCYLENRKINYWVAACFFAAIATLMKLSAISITLSLVGIGLLYGGTQRTKLITSAIIAAVTGMVCFAAYGAYYDWSIFRAVLLANTNRFYGAGSEIVFQAVNQFRITTNKFLTDGWLTLGWLSVFSAILTGKQETNKQNAILISFLSYLFILILMGSESYGWYHFPLLPFLSIFTARLIEKLLLLNNLAVFTIAMLLPIGTQVHRLIGVEGFQKYVGSFRLGVLLILFIFFLNLHKNKPLFKGLSTVIMVCMFLGAIFLSAQVVLYYSYERWFTAT